MRNNARGLTVPAVRQSPGEDTPAWLSAMDRNGDGEISRREFLGTPEQFARFDANDDGYLESAEATAAAPPAAESIRP
jgi:Ca2+-binding EF-hand superfamily protein